MAVRFSCPCGKQLVAESRYAGNTVRCMTCRRKVVIPPAYEVVAGPGFEVVPDPEPPPPAPPPPRQPTVPARLIDPHATQVYKDAGVEAVAMSPDGQQVASASADPRRGFQVWDRVTWTAAGGFPAHGKITLLAYTPDGGELLSANLGDFCAWDPRTGRKIAERRCPDVRLLLPAVRRAVCWGPRVAVYEFATDAPVRYWPAPDFSHLAASATGRYAALDLNPAVGVFDVESGTLLRAFPKSGARVPLSCLALSGDGRYAAASGMDQRKIGESQEELNHAVMDDLAYQTITPSMVSVYGGDDTVVVWDVAAGKPTCRLTAHTQKVTHLAFTPSGRRLLTASRDGTIRVWDTASGEEVCGGLSRNGTVQCLSVAPDGRHALTGSSWGYVNVWPLPAEPARAPAPPLVMTPG